MLNVGIILSSSTIGMFAPYIYGSKIYYSIPIVYISFFLEVFGLVISKTKSNELKSSILQHLKVYFVLTDAFVDITAIRRVKLSSTLQIIAGTFLIVRYSLDFFHSFYIYIKCWDQSKNLCENLIEIFIQPLKLQYYSLYTDRSQLS